jgi:hypothetical protein
MAGKFGFAELIKQAMQKRAQDTNLQGFAPPQRQPHMPPESAPSVVPQQPDQQALLDQVVRSQVQPQPAPERPPAEMVGPPQPSISPLPQEPIHPQIQELRQSGQQLTEELGGPANVQQAVTESIGDAIGEPLGAGEVQGAIPLMKEILADQTSLKEAQKSALTKKIEAGDAGNLTKNEKIAIALLMILPAIAGGLMGGKKGLGQGLEASGRGLLAVRQELGQREDRADRAGDESLQLRKDIVKTGEDQLETTRKLGEAESVGAKISNLHPDFKIDNVQFASQATKKQQSDFVDIVKSEKKVNVLYDKLDNILTDWDTTDKVRAVLGDPNKADRVKQLIADIIFQEKTRFKLGSLQEGEFKLMQNFVGDPTKFSNIIAKKSTILSLINQRRDDIKQQVNIDAEAVGHARVGESKEPGDESGDGDIEVINGVVYKVLKDKDGNLLGAEILEDN